MPLTPRERHDVQLASLIALGVAVTTTIVSEQAGIKLNGDDSETSASGASHGSAPAESKAPIKAHPAFPARAPAPPAPPKPSVLHTQDFNRWDRAFDVIVVGSGAAGLTAALSALWARPRSKVLVLEKDAAVVGGTSLKSGGITWIPNNHLMKEGLGLDDSMMDFTSLVAKAAYPGRFQPTTGLTEEGVCFKLSPVDSEMSLQDASRIREYFVSGRALFQQLADTGVAANPTLFRNDQGEVMTDYTYDESNPGYNTAPKGRGVGVGMPSVATSVIGGLKSVTGALSPAIIAAGRFAPALKELLLLNTFGIKLDHGVGQGLIDQLKEAVIKLGGVIETGSHVDALVFDGVDGDEQVAGVRVATAKGPTHLAATRGVIFASGGFAHDREMVTTHIVRAGRTVDQTGASAGCTGDFHKMCVKLGVELRDMDKIWHCEAHWGAPKGYEVNSCIFQLRGDSFFVVNGDGVRVYNEKEHDDVRARVHFTRPENQVLFAICDARCVDVFGSDVAATWPRDPKDPLYTSESSIARLAAAVQARFTATSPEHKAQLEELGNGLLPTFTANFQANLARTLEEFNVMALSGVDPAFGRGKTKGDRQWNENQVRTSFFSSEASPANVAMRPLSRAGPFFCVPLVASIADTKGGARVDVAQRVLRYDGSPVPRLYAAGSAASSVFGDSYISGGVPLGNAMVSGYIAGLRAAADAGDVPAVTRNMPSKL